MLTSTLYLITLTVSLKVKDLNMQFFKVIPDYLANDDRYGTRLLLLNGSYILAFEWHTYIFVWSIVKTKIKVLLILTVNIFETVTDRKILLLPSNRKSCIGFRWAYSHLTSFTGQGQDHAYFDSKYLENGDREEKHYNCSQIGCHVLAFDCHIYIWSWPIIKVKVKVMHILIENILEIV